MKSLFTIVPDFLRDPDAFFAGIARDEQTGAITLRLAASAGFSLAVYGFMLGLSHGWLQALSSAVKMPLLFLLTMAFCLPALHFFSLALLGSPLRMLQVTAVVLAGISVTGFLLLGLAPVTLFFVLTSEDYGFFQLLAVAFVALGSAIGVYFLWRGMTRVESNRDDRTQNIGRRLLVFWMGLYAFVGTQMTWRLSPLVGDPAQPFILLGPSRDNFYMDVIHALQRALGLSKNANGGDLLTVMLLVCGMGGVGLFLGVTLGLGNRRRVIVPPAPQAATPGEQ